MKLLDVCKSIFTKFGKMLMIKKRYFPHEFMYKMLLSGVFRRYYEIDLKDSWMYAAAEKKTYYCSRLKKTMGNIFASYVIKEI
jgi:deoxyhypusine synthase